MLPKSCQKALSLLFYLQEMYLENIAQTLCIVFVYNEPTKLKVKSNKKSVAMATAVGKCSLKANYNKFLLQETYSETLE